MKTWKHRFFGFLMGRMSWKGWLLVYLMCFAITLFMSCGLLGVKDWTSAGNLAKAALAAIPVMLVVVALTVLDRPRESRKRQERSLIKFNRWIVFWLITVWLGLSVVSYWLGTLLTPWSRLTIALVSPIAGAAVFCGFLGSVFGVIYYCQDKLYEYHKKRQY